MVMWSLVIQRFCNCSRQPSQIDIGLIVLKPGTNDGAVQLAAGLPNDVKSADKAAEVKSYWASSTGVALFFGLGGQESGFIVGIVIVYQIALYSDVSNTCRPATLKAMVSWSYLQGSNSEALLLSGSGLYSRIHPLVGLPTRYAATLLPIAMTLERAMYWD